MRKYRLRSGELQNMKYPDTFQLPHKEELDAIDVGDIVKLMFIGSDLTERMWVKVTKVQGKGRFEGTLDNAPLSDMGIKPGALIKFERKHIISVF